MSRDTFIERKDTKTLSNGPLPEAVYDTWVAFRQTVGLNNHAYKYEIECRGDFVSVAVRVHSITITDTIHQMMNLVTGIALQWFSLY